MFKILYYIFGVLALICAIVRIGLAEASFYNKDFYNKYSKLHTVISISTWISIILMGISFMIYKIGGL